MNNQTTLSASEIDFIYTGWQQMYSETYDFIDYLKIQIEVKKRTGTVYR